MRPARALSTRQMKSGITGFSLSLLVVVLSVRAQELLVPEMPASANIDVEQLESAISAVQSRAGLSEETRETVIDQLRDAQGQVRRKLDAEKAALGYAQMVEAAPAQIAALRESLDEEDVSPVTAESLGITETMSLAELELRLTREAGELSEVEAQLADLEAQIVAEDNRPGEARARLEEVRSRAGEIAAAPRAPPPPGEDGIVTDARRLAVEIRRTALSAEINRLEREISSHGVRLDLLKAQRDVAAQRAVRIKQRVDMLRSEANGKRQAAITVAQQAAAAVELAATDKHPAVRELAEGNASLTRELPAVAAAIEQATVDLDRVENEVKRIGQRLARSRQRLEVGGLNRVIGQLFLEERRNLPQIAQDRAQIRSRRGVLADIGLAQVRIQEERRELLRPDGGIEQVMAKVAEDVSDADQLASTRAEARALLRDRRELINQADNTYGTYLQVLGDLDDAQRRLLRATAEYQEFLDQNLLWIPSAPVLGLGDWREALTALASVTSPDSWVSVLAGVTNSIRDHAVFAIAAALLFAALVITRGRLAAQYKRVNAKVGRLSTDHIGLTLAALAMAAIRAMPLPLLLACAGWLLTESTQQTPFSMSVARSLVGVAPFLYNILLFRVVSAHDGVARIHFGADEQSLVIVRRQLDRLVAIGVPLVFVTILFYSSQVASDRSTLGRVAFVALMVVLTMVLHPLLQPESGVVASYYRNRPSGWASRLRWLWYALAAGGPLLFAVMAVLGFLHTSGTLISLLVDTIWLALALLVVNMVVLRWLALARRKIAWQQALKERDARREEHRNGPAQEMAAEAEGELPVTETTLLDLDAVDLQTRKLVQSALLLVAVIAGWTIWAQVLPALNLLDQVALWSQTEIVDGVESVTPVTLADVLFAVLIAAATVVASRNLPGLMEIAFLQRLTLKPGSRYAINTLVRYVVITIGVVSILSTVGWRWSQIQWLVAALSVGLGFGLQEIVANFVSGLVILFERPVRVGDTVTVGELTGTVSRVQIRATTITDWDRKEIIVPNKSFITEQVVNWTLSDPITRVVIGVGVSYNSDVAQAHRIMQETLQSLPLVLDDPPPRVYFIGFGESSLDFKLYVYSRQLKDRLPLTHAVHEAILKALREQGIEIPFPQRDLHMRSTVEAGPAKAVPGPGPAAASDQAPS